MVVQARDKGATGRFNHKVVTGVGPQSAADLRDAIRRDPHVDAGATVDFGVADDHGRFGGSTGCDRSSCHATHSGVTRCPAPAHAPGSAPAA